MGYRAGRKPQQAGPLMLQNNVQVNTNNKRGITQKPVPNNFSVLFTVASYPLLCPCLLGQKSAWLCTGCTLCSEHEPGTQVTLKVFYFAGVASMNITVMCHGSKRSSSFQDHQVAAPWLVYLGPVVPLLMNACDLIIRQCLMFRGQVCDAFRKSYKSK